MGETKRYYDQYNVLGEKQGYLTKEASLINSIHDNFCKATATASKDKLVESVDNIVKTMQTNLDKVQGRLAEGVNSKEALQQQYSKLVDKERKYSKLVKDSARVRTERAGQLTLPCA